MKQENEMHNLIKVIEFMGTKGETSNQVRGKSDAKTRQRKLMIVLHSGVQDHQSDRRIGSKGETHVALSAIFVETRFSTEICGK